MDATRIAHPYFQDPLPQTVIQNFQPIFGSLWEKIGAKFNFSYAYHMTPPKYLKSVFIFIKKHGRRRIVSMTHSLAKQQVCSLQSFLLR
jgi:hypothetical protein